MTTTSTNSAAGRGLPIFRNGLGESAGGLVGPSASYPAAILTMPLRGFPIDDERASYLGIDEEPDLEPGFSGMASFRWQIEQEIERLISVLDAIDGDADFEQTATETRGAGFASDPSLDDAEPLS